MIGRKSKRNTQEVVEGPKGYDDFAVSLGDMMRGERATLGKSLLDVQRELRIRASYIAAIENCDPSAFETPGFIAGYVRSYARYLGLDPEVAFDAFCEESGFTTAHGMSAEASGARRVEKAAPTVASDPFGTNTPFTPIQESLLSRIEMRAVGSSLVLVALIAAIGYGCWSVLNEIQRVTLAPVEQSPVVLSDLDPLEGATRAPNITDAADEEQNVATLGAGVFAPAEALDRLYRPQALDVPVMVARDAPISQLNPDSIGVFTPALPTEIAVVTIDEKPLIPKVVEDAAPELALVAVRPAWVRVSAADGSVVLEKIMDAGEQFVLPATEEAPTLRAGMSGSVYFKVNGELYGPAGEGTGTVRDLQLAIDSVQENYAVADLSEDPGISKVVLLAISENEVIAEE